MFKVPVSLPNPGKRSRVRSSDLDSLTYWWLVVGAKLRKRSLANQIQSLLTAQVARWQSDWLTILEYEAEKAGITPEEMFVSLAIGEEEMEK